MNEWTEPEHVVSVVRFGGDEAVCVLPNDNDGPVSIDDGQQQPSAFGSIGELPADINPNGNTPLGQGLARVRGHLGKLESSTVASVVADPTDEVIKDYLDSFSHRLLSGVDLNSSNVFIITDGKDNGAINPSDLFLESAPPLFDGISFQTWQMTDFFPVNYPEQLLDGVLIDGGVALSLWGVLKD